MATAAAKEEQFFDSLLKGLSNMNIMNKIHYSIVFYDLLLASLELTSLLACF